jgi:hypothetical protein
MGPLPKVTESRNCGKLLSDACDNVLITTLLETLQKESQAA